MEDTVTGELISVGCHKPDSGWCRLNFSDDTRRFVAVGFVSDHSRLVEGQVYRLTGIWQTHEKWGPQFKFMQLARNSPVGKEQITRYIQKFCHGVGGRTAEAIWNEFGTDCLRVIREEPERLAEKIKRITLNQAMDYSRALKGNEGRERVMQELMELFEGLRISEKSIASCIDLFGDEAADVIRKNPYMMLEKNVERVGFRTADAVFLRNGGSKDNAARSLWCLYDILCSQHSGSTWIPIGEAEKMFLAAMQNRESECFRQALADAKAREWVIVEDSFMAWIVDSRIETQLAEEIVRLIKRKRGTRIIHSEQQAARGLNQTRKMQL